MRTDPLALMAEGAAMRQDVVGLSFGMIQAWVVYSPEVARSVMTPGDTVWKGTRGSKLLRRILGAGLLTTEGVVWRERRKRAQARFRHESLKRLPEIVRAHTDRLVAQWSGQSEVNAMDGFSALALGVVCELLFGVDPGDDAPRIHAALNEVMGGFLWMMTFPVEGVDRWPIPAAARHRAAVATLNEVVDRLIAQRRKRWPAEGDLLADWIAAHDLGELSVDDLRAEVVTMLLAGHETTANAMSFCLALLGTHPEAQAAVRKALAEADQGPLDRAFDEALRLYPPAWVLARAVSAPTPLSGGITAQPGDFCFIPIAAIHRDTRWWDDADSFRPERHLSLDAEAKAALLPFGIGPRRCIGETFARVEARVALAAILERFEVHAEAVPEREPSITLRPRGPVRVGLRPVATVG